MDMSYSASYFRFKTVKYVSLLFTIAAATLTLFYVLGVNNIHLQASPFSSSSLFSFANPSKRSLFSSSDSSSSSSLSGMPQQHVYYLKTHKTGSTTMLFIFAEYCRTHDLLPLLPRPYTNHINQKPPLTSGQLSLLWQVKTFDMVFNHHIFDSRMFTFLHKDTFTLTTLREPFDNFVSAFLYYRNVWDLPYLKIIPGEDPVEEFLKDPTKYEVGGYRSYTNNRQSLDLGYNISKGFNDLKYIKTFIRHIEKRFNLVLITDYFDESLIVMKRTLNWNTEDILYISKNRGIYFNDRVQNPDNEALHRRLHANFSQADIMLYNHFLAKFKEIMKNEVGLQEEVREFRSILDKLRDFCQYFNLNTLVIPPGKWTNGFYISPYKCKWLGLKETQITKSLQERQRIMFQRG